jgi:hypothetical protein
VRTVLLGFSAVLFLFGCGAPDHSRVGDPAWLVQSGDAEAALEALTSSCNDAFVVPLIQQTDDSAYAPMIKFVSSKKNPVSDDRSPGKLTMNQRCQEMDHRFSGSPIKDGSNTVENNLSIELSFSATADQEEQMKLGKAVSIRPDKADLEFTDGSLNNASSELEIRCPGAATVTCKVDDVTDEYRKCASYNVNYSDTCSFRSKLLFYSFSDHKKAQLDAIGELKVSGQSGAQIKFNKISWAGLY